MALIKKRSVNWYVVVFIVVNLIGTLLVVRIEDSYIDNVFKSHLKVYKDDVDDVMSDYMHSFELFRHILSREIENNPDPNQIWDYLKSIDQEFLAIEGQTFDGLYMYYQDRYLYSWDTPYEQYENSGYDATSRPWYQDALKGAGEIVFTPPYMSYANHYILSTISQLQPDGKTVFAYDIKMGDIQELVTSKRQFNDEQIMIFDRQGTIIGSSDEKYLGGNLNTSLEKLKQAVEDIKADLKNGSNNESQVKKLQDQAEYAQAFYDFQSEFSDEYKYLNDHQNQAHIIKLNNSRYYSYLVKGDSYSYLIMVPFFTMLQDTMQVWLVPMLLLEILLIYVMSRISKELRNRELKAAYIELGQTQKRLEIALSVAQKAAAIDELTGMMNAKSFRKAVIDHIDSMEQDDHGILIMLDGDRFKSINDQYGHLIGDEIIKLVAQMIVGRIRTIDLASRLHGDEYAIFIADSDKYNVAKTIVNDINESIAKEAKKRNMPIITVSAGAVVVKSGDQYIELAKLADEALYEAKKTHNGGFYGI